MNYMCVGRTAACLDNSFVSSPIIYRTFYKISSDMMLIALERSLRKWVLSHRYV